LGWIGLATALSAGSRNAYCDLSFGTDKALAAAAIVAEGRGLAIERQFEGGT
jgi:hypothetical protein